MSKKPKVAPSRLNKFWVTIGSGLTFMGIYIVLLSFLFSLIDIFKRPLDSSLLLIIVSILTAPALYTLSFTHLEELGGKLFLFSAILGLIFLGLFILLGIYIINPLLEIM